MTTNKDYAAIYSVDELAKLADKLLADGLPTGFDVETGYAGPETKRRALDHFHSDQFVVGFSISNSPHWARYIPLKHDSGENIDDPAGAWEAVREVLTKGHIVAHNVSYELHAVRKAAGIDLASEGTLTDTMLLAYTVAAWAHGNYRTIIGLKDLVEVACGHKMMHIHELWPDLPKNKEPSIRFNTLPLSPEVIAYACEDALWVLPLRDKLNELAQDRDVAGIQRLEHRILRVKNDMEWHGVCVDWPAMEEAYAQAQTFVPAMESHVKYQLSVLAEKDLSELNLNSAQQMKKLLFDDLGLETTRLTKKGAEDDSMPAWQRMSSDAKSLALLAKKHPGIKSLLEYREVQNLTRRLKQWLRDYNVYEDGRVHPNYNQAVVPSGRFSANEPSIQQLQKHWEWVINPDSVALNKDAIKGVNGLDYWSGNFRDFIVAAPGSYLLTFDYGQAELRMLAGASQEPALLEAFATGTDVHTATASKMLGMPISRVTPKDRQIGKTLNFSLLYGQSPKAMGEALGIPFAEAKALYNLYFSTFSRVSSWVNSMHAVGSSEHAYVTDVFARRIPIWEFKSEKSGIRAKGERLLVNAPIQGAAATYAKLAMVNSYNSLKKVGWWENGCTMLMNQHDSLTFEVSNELDPNEVRALLQGCVVFELDGLKDYPQMVADWEIGQKWGSSSKWPADAKAVFKDGRWQVHKPNLTRVRFTTTKDPRADMFGAFLTALKSAPGTVAVEVSMPMGSKTLPFKVALRPEHLPRLANLLENATIDASYEED